jgi:calcium permeable stress-gated cation channel
LNSAIITFCNVEAAYKASRLRRRLPYRFETTFSPNANEIIWENLNIGGNIRIIRSVTTTTIALLMIALWAGPVAVVGSLSNINYLVRSLSSLPPIVAGLLTGVVPSIGLAVLSAMLPLALTRTTSPQI